MPFLNIKIAAPKLTLEQTRSLQTQATELIANVLGKKAELTAVLVEHFSQDTWMVGWQAVGMAAHLDVKITAGTNSPEEKARFIAEANALLHRVLGANLPLATYVIIDEVPGEAWGYGGLTQTQRRETAGRTVLERFSGAI